MLDKLVSHALDFRSHPNFELIIFSVIALYSVYVYAAARSIFALAYHSIVLIICLGLAFSYGYDAEDHAARLYEIRAHFDNGDLDLYTRMGDVSLPTFYFYSPVFYVLSLPFSFIGLNEYDSTRALSILFFFQMAVAFRVLCLEILYERRPNVQNLDAISFVIAVLFVSASYIHANFAIRAAFPEAASLSLIPAVLLTLRRRDWVLSVFLICLQISIHPPVILQSAFIIIATFLLLFARRIEDVAKLGLCYGFAVVLTIPSWFWAFSDRNKILGLTGLPVEFIDTFLNPVSLVNPLSWKSVGPYLTLLVLVFLLKRGRKDWLAFVTLALSVFTLFVQTDVLKPIAVHIPLLDIGLFVWRWMVVPVWFMAITLLLIMRMDVFSRGLRIVLILAGMQAAVISVSQIAPIRSGDIEAYFQRFEYKAFWGRSEFFPAYAAGFETCDPGRIAAYDHVLYRDVLVDSFQMEKDVAMLLAPEAGVEYFVNGAPAPKSTCGEFLLISKGESGGTAQLSVSENFVHQTPWIRVLLPVSYIILPLGVLLYRRARRAFQS